MDGLSSRVEMKTDRINKLEDKSIEFTQPEQQRKTFKKKGVGKAAGTYGAVTEYPAFISS